MFHMKCRGFVDSFKREQFKLSKKVKVGVFEASFGTIFIEKGYEKCCELGLIIFY